MPESGAERLERAFRDAGRPLFVPYVMGGYPDIEASKRHARILARHADIIELGIPFSDPLADGPTIQAAGQVALDAGTRPMDVLAIADDLRDGPPVVAMTYYNTVIAQGADTQNPVVLSYGSEGSAWDVNRLHVAHNTFGVNHEGGAHAPRKSLDAGEVRQRNIIGIDRCQAPVGKKWER